MNRLRTYTLGACVLAAAGCGTVAPTAPEIGAARFDEGGFTYGGGSFAGDGTTCEDGEGGGFTYGGGSVFDPCLPPSQP